MPTAIFTSVAENFHQISNLFGDFDEFPRNYTFFGGTPLLKMPSTLGYCGVFSRNIREWYVFTSKMS